MLYRFTLNQPESGFSISALVVQDHYKTPGDICLRGCVARLTLLPDHPGISVCSIPSPISRDMFQGVHPSPSGSCSPIQPQCADFSFRKLTEENVERADLLLRHGSAEDEGLSNILSALVFHDRSQDTSGPMLNLDGDIVTLTLLPRSTGR